VIKSATINPAREIGETNRIGSIKVGKQADLVVMDKEWNIVSVFKNGKLMR
jgi:N-acetylglucosamine-6-phosphate deacetylase